MDFGWQDIAAVFAVAGAAGYLLRRVLRVGLLKKPAACGGCSGCMAEQTDQTLVTIELPRRQN